MGAFECVGGVFLHRCTTIVSLGALRSDMADNKVCALLLSKLTSEAPKSEVATWLVVNELWVQPTVVQINGMLVMDFNKTWMPSHCLYSKEADFKSLINFGYRAVGNSSAEWIKGGSTFQADDFVGTVILIPLSRWTCSDFLCLKSLITKRQQRSHRETWAGVACHAKAEQPLPLQLLLLRDY